MIKDKNQKKAKIIRIINNDISGINFSISHGDALNIYKEACQLRNEANDIETFICNDYNIKILHETLVSWNMNQRGARLKTIDEFKKAIISNLENLKKIDELYCDDYKLINKKRLFSVLRNTYDNLKLMDSKSRFVSNAKILHFLFPKLLMPMDISYTLNFLYNSTVENVDRYIEILELSFEILQLNIDWIKYYDDKWNTTAPKIIDNAIIIAYKEQNNDA